MRVPDAIRRALERVLPWYDPGAALARHRAVITTVYRANRAMGVHRRTALRGSFRRVDDRLSR